MRAHTNTPSNPVFFRVKIKVCTDVGGNKKGLFVCVLVSS